MQRGSARAWGNAPCALLRRPAAILAVLYRLIGQSSR
jgi:hypothetical protein